MTSTESASSLVSSPHDDPTHGNALRRAGVWSAVRSPEGVVILTATVCVTLLWEYGRKDAFFRQFAEFVSSWPYPGLWPSAYIGVSSVLLRTVVPLVVIVLILRARPSSYGYALPKSWRSGRIYLAMLAIMTPVVWVAAGTEAFQSTYPWVPEVRDSWRALLLWEVFYLAIFVSGESFWRGFLVFGLFRRFGYHAVSISMVPYVMIHFGKPIVETLGAIVAAYALGYLALKHRTFVWGVVVHFGVALMMDVFALLRGPGLPRAW